MEQKAKWDVNPGLIVGLTLSFMGAVYLGVSLPLFHSADADAVAVRSIFIPLGLVFLVIGIVLLIRAAAKKRQADQLIADGRYIWATVTQLKEIRTINGFRGHPWVILASYTGTNGQTHHFQSRHLYRKPDASIIGKPIKVYIQGSSYTLYYVDVEPLLQRLPMK